MRIHVILKLDFDEATVDDTSSLLEALGESARELIPELVDDVCMNADVVLDDSNIEVRRV